MIPRFTQRRRRVRDGTIFPGRHRRPPSGRRGCPPAPKECGQLLSHMKRSELVPLTLVNTLSELDNPLSGLDFEEIKAILKGLVNGRLRNSRRLSIAPTGSISISSSLICPSVLFNSSCLLR